MKYTRYCPTTLEKLPHLKNIRKCWQTNDGVYDILYEEVEIAGHTCKHLLIQRIDTKPIHNFMDIQEIKDDLLGEDTVAIEVYPKKEDLMNGSNTYHLWTWKDIFTPNLKDLKALRESNI